ncbi:DUF4419 domain-containing protein [Actinomadura sp. 6N118]|uniref:DUF4419 domain-containing protein n=1 Tax=Actinomadura sp. 6N118 TaxID=3375151 RepID=UPI0037A3B943
MAIFPVDDVVPASEALPARPLRDQFPDALVLGGDPAMRVLEPDGVHPLLSAVGRAFADHRPLALSPDAVWLTILHGVAQHVRLHAEELRPRLVQHADRKRIEVVIDGPVPTDAASWQDIAETFGKLLSAEVGDSDAFECDFSTSTDVERMAGKVALLDAYSPYFTFWVTFVCGIPSITLTGTVEDWRKIRARVDTIATFGLDAWCRSLIPITDQFVRAAGGDVDTAFWRRIYSPADAYGGNVITGWIARLYPYLTGGGVADRPNPLLELPIDQPRDLTVNNGMGYDGPGVRSDAVPATLSQARINLNDQVQGENRSVALYAGLVGVTQDDDGTLRPVAGWHLAPAEVEIDDVLDRIVRDHETTPPEPVRLWEASADLMALYRRIGSATLFDGAWRLRPAAAHRRVRPAPEDHSLIAIIDLPDGRCVAAANDYRTETSHWVVCHVEEDADDRLRLMDRPSDVPVYGTSLALLLDAALDSGGDFTHLETGRLDGL